MRVATSTVYYQQSNAIDNLETNYQTEAAQLSTGKSLNVPSDNPEQIAEDLGVRTTIATQTQQATNVQAATAQLTATDSALSSLTSLLQSVRQLDVRSATDFSTSAGRKNTATEVEQYLQQAVAIANTQYNGAYIFAGSTQSSAAPVTTTGSPISAVSFTGNEQSLSPLLYNGQSFAVSPTLQQAFNYNATDGSPSVFDTLINLRNALNNGTVTDESATALNHVGSVIYGAASPAAVQSTLANAPFATTLKPDSAGTYSITINSADSAGVNHVESYTFTAATLVDDGTNTASSVTGAINANSAVTGLTATFNAQTQRLTLTNAGGGAFSVTDEPSAGATNSANFTEAFGLTGSATLAQTISTQLGDIDNVIDVTLNGRALVGTRINALAQINDQVTAEQNNNLSVQSGIEDTNVAKTTTQFSLTQTALTAAYSTTTRIEAKDLFDYL